MNSVSALRENQIHHLFESLEDSGNGDYIDANALTRLLINRYQHFDGLEDLVDQLLERMSPTPDGKINYQEFKSYVNTVENALKHSFFNLDRDNDGYLSLQDVLAGCRDLGINLDFEQASVLFECLDVDGDGRVSYSDWTHQLLFIPLDKNESPLKAAYMFFIDDLSSEGDVILSSESSHGLGYFLAGGLAGVVSRTCTAPFDRLKVFLIAQSGQPAASAAAAAASKAATTSSKISPGSAGLSTVKSASSSINAKDLATATTESVKLAPAELKKSVTDRPIFNALRILWRQGGVRAFFVGNGLNVVKVFPESAMKFGSFETAKRFLARVEGVSDPSELSRGATFLAGGLGGMAAQLTVYPIDTLKFRIQCEAQYSKYSGNRLLIETVRQMWADGGISMFYRGLYVGVLGIFPFAALDLGIFSAMKRAYIANQAHKLHIDESDVSIGNFVVLTMGALSGSVGASVVYPVNLLRTRLQAQGTTGHPYTYNGFIDVFKKTVQRDGYRGLFRGLAPNLAKVAPSVSISYLIYENAKALMHLD